MNADRTLMPNSRGHPKNVKCLYFKAYAHIKLKEYDEGDETLEKLFAVDPDHAEGKKLKIMSKK